MQLGHVYIHITIMLMLFDILAYLATKYNCLHLVQDRELNCAAITSASTRYKCLMSPSRPKARYLRWARALEEQMLCMGRGPLRGRYFSCFWSDGIDVPRC